MENTALSRKEKERLRQRRDILDAALSLFADKGYYNVSMQEVAEKAEFAMGTLYKFFRTKEELYKSIVLEQSDKIERAFMRALEESDDEAEILRNYLRVKGDIYREDLPYLRLYLAESRGVSYDSTEDLYQRVRQGYDLVLDKLASVFASGIKKMRFKKLADPHFLAVTFDGAANALLFLGIRDPEGHPYSEDPGAVLDIFMQGLLEP